MKLNFYEDKGYYYFWKEQGIASNLGENVSFLEYFIDVLAGRLEVSAKVFHVMSYLDMLWGQKNEFGLLNRLDVDTAGLLYFAKSSNSKNIYQDLQKELKLEKIYITDVKWDFYHDEVVVETPIMHHRHIDEKMITIASEKSIRKWRGKQHLAKTYVKKLYYDKEEDISTLEITISKWVRHQIRVHLASIGDPVLGDELYGKEGDKLCLWSIWLRAT